MTKAVAARGVGGEVTARKKRTLGRQKIEIKVIKNKDARQVCFSKRREGVFKKACELSVLCGAHVAVVFFSPGGKPHSFGYPSVPDVVGRFLDPAAAPWPVVAAQPAVVGEFNRREECLSGDVDAEARRRHDLGEAPDGVIWSDADVRRAGLPELEAMLAELERVQAEASERAHELIAENTSAGGGAGNLVHYLGAGGFASDGSDAGSSSHDVAAIDTKMMLMCGGGGDIGHAPPELPFAGGSHVSTVIDTKMMLMCGGNDIGIGHAPPELPFAPMMMPPPPHLPLAHFCHGFGYNGLGVDYGYSLGDGHEMEGFYNGTTCNFFGQE